MMQKRPFDIIVYGATGFTGKLVAEYLLEHGFVDKIVHRKDLRKEIGNILSILLKKQSGSNSENLNETSELSIETREAS